MALNGAKTSYDSSSKVQTYTKIIADAISTQRPNNSINIASSSSRSACIIPSYYDNNDNACVSFELPAPPQDLECEDRSRLLVILRWCTTSMRNVLDAYVSSPMVLVIVPLVVGVLLGILVGWWLFSTTTPSADTSSLDEETRKEGIDALDMKQRQEKQSNLGYGKSSLRMNQRRAKDRNCDGILGYVTLRPIQFIMTTFSYLLHFTINRNNMNSSSPLSTTKFNDDTNNSIDQNDNTNNTKQQQLQSNNDDDNNTTPDQRDSQTRQYLLSPLHTQPESNVPHAAIPHHIAVIMDGNRRYGRARYGSTTRGHWDGSKTLVDFCKWCLAEGVKVLTVYAFSTENWNRTEGEVSALMRIFLRYSEEVRVEALERGIKVVVLSTEDDKFPNDVMAGLTKMVQDTKHCKNFTLNICLSYGSRGEIVNACKALASDAVQGKIAISDINEAAMETKMLTYPCPDPDIIIRTSGEFRLSNFLLWQLAYSEMFFLEKKWPELTKGDLIEVIRTFAEQRERRFGK